MSAELLQRLAEAGTPLALVMEVAEALADARAAERLLQARREKDAARQQDKRDRDKAEHHVTSRDTVDVADVTAADPSPQSPPLKVPPDPLKITPPLTPQPVVVVGRANPKFPPPEGVTAEQFKAFRQQRKKPLNEHSYALLCGKLSTLADAGWPPGDMIDLAIERGWETVFEPKDRVNGRQPNSGQVNGLRGTRPDPSLDFVRQANADLAAERRGASDHRGDRPALPAGGTG